ncbi:MAG: DNA polymerase III subunit [Planctomycetales bacterium]|nr:DNA polymerase III subunit [Planctomycetales bacterium]
MLWSELYGHDRQRKWFQTALANGRLATSFLFVGPSGIGKRQFALLLAQSLLCRASVPQSLDPCGQCEDCAQVQAATHPDLIQLAKPADKAFLPIELLIGDREKRMREGLCHDISLKPYGGRRKVAIVDDADTLNTEGANCLLKTLEEPPPDSILILLGTNLQRQLPTIRSRCQTIVFNALTTEQLAKVLVERGVVLEPVEAQNVAAQANGSFAAAAELADIETQEFRLAVLELLAGRPLACSQLVKCCASFADAAGKDTRLKRDRLKIGFRTCANLYRQITIKQFQQAGLAARATDSDRLMERHIDRAMAMWFGGSAAARECWNRCLTAMEQVDRNANQTALLEAWAFDLARLSYR